MASRGIRNNNPGNIRRRNGRWLGLARRDEMTAAQKREKAFAVFTSPEWGIRAMVKILQTYGRKYSLDTVRGIIARWAPPVENDTGSYVDAVAKALGVDASDTLNLSNTRVMMALVKAIIKHENSEQPYDDATIRAAIALARVKASKPKPLLKSKRLRGGALITGITGAMTQSQLMIDAARRTVASILPDVEPSGYSYLAIVLGAVLIATAVYVGWTVWIDYRDRGEPEEATR